MWLSARLKLSAVTGTGSAEVIAFGVVDMVVLLLYLNAVARTGGVYGSGVPGDIGGYFFRLCSKSTITLMAGPAIHELCSPVCGYSSFGSVIRLKAFGEPSLVGGVHQSRCSS